MKNKLNMSALAALVMICSGGAFAEGNSVTLNAAVNVESPDNCAIRVTSEGNTAWSPKWTLSKNSESGSVTRGDSDSNEPLFVRVQLTDDSASNCNLSTLRFGAGTPGSTHLNDGSGGAYTVRTSQDNGYWRYMPVVAKLQLFTDAAATPADAVALNKVTVLDAAGGRHRQSESAVHTAMQEVTGVADFGSQAAIPLTNSYLSANGVAPLSNGNGSATLSYEASLDSGKAVKNALIGVGVLLAKNPEDSNGQLNLKAVTDSDTVNMPFTLNVTLP